MIRINVLPQLHNLSKSGKLSQNYIRNFFIKKVKKSPKNIHVFSENTCSDALQNFLKEPKDLLEKFEINSKNLIEFKNKYLLYVDDWEADKLLDLVDEISINDLN